MGKAALFLRGVPTEPDVNTLLAAYGKPAEGVLIAYDDIAQRIGVSPESYRFKTVTAAWRRKLNELYNTLLLIEDRAFRVRLPGERVVHAKSKLRSSMRAARVAVDVAQNTVRTGLTQRQVEDLDKVQRVGSTTQLAALSEARKPAPPRLAAVSDKAAQAG